MNIFQITAPNGRVFVPGKHGYITGNIAVPLSKLIDLDLEGVLDEMSESLTGSELLSDISYKAVGVNDEGDILIEVCGDPDMILNSVSES